jgi:hypothetical protein
MVTKDIVILANSDKLKGFCIAGKDIKTGEWIRIINNFKFKNGDAAPFYFTGLKNLYGHGYGPYLGAQVRINFSGPSPLYCQPENWEIDGTKWKYLGKLSDDKLRNLIDKKYPMWLGNSTFGEPDKIPIHECNPKKPLTSSLHFVELTASKHKPKIYMKTNFKGNDSLALAFTLNGIKYDLTVKDHDFIWKQNKGEIKIGEYNSLLVTLGIGQLFEKMQAHYKLAVGIVQYT